MNKEVKFTIVNNLNNSIMEKYKIPRNIFNEVINILTYLGSKYFVGIS